ncbi:hypothetical protein MLD38_039733 [Melastoma candidum]|uniref:Uncharacterized protein n=1 Tax=Melastoma candidum TaxID=119954 RepID=A0ACB9L4D2_9MYRT|nr:hypothetical protein MLD38_039733 [Melastoma candidum]
MAKLDVLVLTLCVVAIAAVSLPSSLAFQSDKLLVEDEEFGLEGIPSGSRSEVPQPSPPTTATTRRGYSDSDSDSDSKVQFPLEHAFGDSDFTPAGSFSARIKTWSRSPQKLIMPRFSRNGFTAEEKAKFQKLIEEDDFYKIRVPSNILSPPGREFVVSSVKARCLLRDNLEEYFSIHADGLNILAVDYGSPKTCPYPRQAKLPGKWTFTSHAVFKSAKLAERRPIFAEESLIGDNGEAEVVKPPERSFWAKYWMYLIPLGLIVMNAMTQAMNMAEDGTGGQGQQGAVRGPAPAATRRR